MCGCNLAKEASERTPEQVTSTCGLRPVFAKLSARQQPPKLRSTRLRFRIVGVRFGRSPTILSRRFLTSFFMHGALLAGEL